MFCYDKKHIQNVVEKNSSVKKYTPCIQEYKLTMSPLSTYGVHVSDFCVLIERKIHTHINKRNMSTSQPASYARRFCLVMICSAILINLLIFMHNYYNKMERRITKTKLKGPCPYWLIYKMLYIFIFI